MNCEESKREEEWTRRKSYLLRRLFVDEPLLSTISEEDESLTQYLRNQSLEPQYLENRSISPLPDLVIEIIPRRPKIYYDEPEEFYSALEKEMKKLYRRDYLNIYSTSSDSNFESISDPEIDVTKDNFDHNLEGNNEKPGGCLDASISDEDISIDEEEYDEGDTYEILNKTIDDRLSQTFIEAITEERIPSKSIDSQKEQEISISLHEEKVNASSDTTSEDKSTKGSELQNESDNSTLVLYQGDDKEMLNEEESEASEQEKSIKLAENNGASSLNSDSLSSIPEPDIMRRHETRVSVISVPNRYSEIFLGEVSEFRKKSLTMDVDFDICDETYVIDFAKETQVADESPDISMINATSTPKSLQKSTVNRWCNRKNSMNRFKPYSPVSSRSSTKLKYNKAQQTSFSDEGSDNQSLWCNFFVGIPKFFKLL